MIEKSVQHFFIILKHTVICVNARLSILAPSLLTLYLMLIPSIATATMPVIDYTAIGKMVQQYQKLQQLYQNAQERLNKAQQLVTDSEGHYGFGAFQNTAQDLKNREWSPDNWNDTLKGLSGGNPDRYQQLRAEYKKSHPTLNETDYRKGTSKEKNKIYQHSIQVNQAAIVNASYAYNDLKQHLKNVHDISMKIEQAKNTKAAVDLNSRLNAEIAYISIQELKMLTLINQQLALKESNVIDHKTESAKFNTLPVS